MSGTALIDPFAFLERTGIHEGQHVADLGCGSLGHFVFPAAKLVGPGGIVYAVDIQRPALERIQSTIQQEQLVNVKTVWSDIDVFGATKIPAASLDLTLLINNLPLSRNRADLIREMVRLTKPGGRIVVSDWKTTASPIGPPNSIRISREEAKKLFDIPDLTRIDDFDPGPYHYALVYVITSTSPTELLV